MADVFYVEQDEYGNEVSRERKGRGRVKLGWAKGQDGNYYRDPDFDPVAHAASQSAKARFQRYYITLDHEGKEIGRKPCGRGRPKKDFVKGEDGHFYLTLPNPDEIAETPAIEVAVEQDDIVENGGEKPDGTVVDSEPVEVDITNAEESDASVPDDISSSV